MHILPQYGCIGRPEMIVATTPQCLNVGVGPASTKGLGDTMVQHLGGVPTSPQARTHIRIHPCPHLGIVVRAHLVVFAPHGDETPEDGPNWCVGGGQIQQGVQLGGVDGPIMRQLLIKVCVKRVATLCTVVHAPKCRIRVVGDFSTRKRSPVVTQGACELLVLHGEVGGVEHHFPVVVHASLTNCVLHHGEVGAGHAGHNGLHVHTCEIMHVQCPILLNPCRDVIDGRVVVLNYGGIVSVRRHFLLALIFFNSVLSNV